MITGTLRRDQLTGRRPALRCVAFYTLFTYQSLHSNQCLHRLGTGDCPIFACRMTCALAASITRLESCVTAAIVAAGGLSGKTINDLQGDADGRMLYILITTRNNPQVPPAAARDPLAYCQARAKAVASSRCLRSSRNAHLWSYCE